MVYRYLYNKFTYKSLKKYTENINKIDNMLLAMCLTYKNNNRIFFQQ